MYRTICFAALGVLAVAGCTLEPEAEGNARRDREVITTDDTTEDTEFELDEMEFTAAEVVDLIVAQEPTVVDELCATTENLTDEMLDQLRPRFSRMLESAAADWGLEATDLYDAVLDECGR